MQNFVTVKNTKFRHCPKNTKFRHIPKIQKNEKKYSEMIKFRQKKTKFVPKTKIPTQKYKIQKPVFERAKRKSQKLFGFPELKIPQHCVPSLHPVISYQKIIHTN